MLICDPWDAERTTKLGLRGFDCILITRGLAPLARTLLPPAPEKQESRTTVTFLTFNSPSFWYNLVTALMIVAFTYFYTAITINPVQMAEDMKKNGGFIPMILDNWASLFLT